MKIVIYCLLFIIFIAQESMAWSGKVEGVHDGDTLKIRDLQNKKHIIRLYGIDCPELEQSYGKKALEKTQKKILGKQVEIIKIATDKYNREVSGIILIEDMLVLQDALISEGLAWVDDRFCKLDICHTCKMHQIDAQSAKRGLWSDIKAIPPWKYRKDKRSAK